MTKLKNCSSQLSCLQSNSRKHFPVCWEHSVVIKPILLSPKRALLFEEIMVLSFCDNWYFIAFITFYIIVFMLWEISVFLYLLNLIFDFPFILVNAGQIPRNILLYGVSIFLNMTLMIEG